MIEVTNISKIFNELKAVDNISFNVFDGEIVGIIGPNGAGKSTTLKMISGIITPTKGNIVVNGFDIVKSPLDAKKTIGYISDNPDMMLRLKGIELLNFLADIYNVNQEERCKKIEDLTKKFEIYDNLNSPILSYSHGMRQKLLIVGSILHNPKTWILDEPLTGLDPKSSYILKNMMLEHKNKNNNVIISTHILEVAEKLCDRIIIIDKGKKLYEGTINDLANNYDNNSLEEIYLKISNENS